MMRFHRFWVSAVVVLALGLNVAWAAKPAGKGKKKADAEAGETEKQAPAQPVNTSRNPLPVAAAVDREIDDALANAKVPANPSASDAEFIRRVSLDITGCIPSAERAKAFLADTSSDKRRKLIDELLASPKYGEHFGDIWYDLLVVRTDDNSRVIPRTFEAWLASEFNANHGWDRIVAAMLTAEGKIDENPATVFIFANSITGVKADEVKVKPAEVLGRAAQRFLGTQIQCAECHNHPFSGYPQTDFWSGAAFFGNLVLKEADKSTLRSGSGVPSIVETAAGDGSIEIPDSKGKRVSPKYPDGEKYTKDGKRLRASFAHWATTSERESMARAAANRMWAHFFARGFVMPVDDLSRDNPASHPGALKALSDELMAADFDLKHLIRCICNSRAYQRSSDAPTVKDKEAKETAERLFARVPLKTMSPRMMLASIGQATGHSLGTGRKDEGGKKKKATPGLIDAFTTSEEPDVADYSQGVPQVLRMMNSGMLDSQCPTLQSLASGKADSAKVIDGLYLACLSRQPTTDERNRMSKFVAKTNDTSRAYAEVMWVLLNCSEFILNH